MKAQICAFALVFLAGCDSPSPQFFGSEKTVLQIEGSTFSVHRMGSLVEVYRTSFEWRPHLSVVLARARLAIEQATGCAIRTGSLSGDHALIRAQLDCDGTLPPVPAPPPRSVYECVIVDVTGPDSNAPAYEELDCELVPG